MWMSPRSTEVSHRFRTRGEVVLQEDPQHLGSTGRLVTEPQKFRTWRRSGDGHRMGDWMKQTSLGVSLCLYVSIYFHPRVQDDRPSVRSLRICQVEKILMSGETCSSTEAVLSVSLLVACWDVNVPKDISLYIV